MFQPPPRPEWLDDPRQPLPRGSGLTAESKRPLPGGWLPAPLLRLMLPVLLVGFFFSVLFRVIVVAVLLALAALVIVVRLASIARGRR